MKSLLIKEFYNIKDTMKTNILIMLVLSIFSVLKNGSAAIMPITVIGMSTLIVPSMRAEKEKDWNKFELTMPINRREIVASKYILYLLLCLMGLILGAIVNVCGMVFSQLSSFDNIDIYLYISMIIALVSGSILIPLVYKLGVDKSETLSLVCYSIPIAILVGLLLYLKERIHTLEIISHLRIWLILILVAMFVIFFISGVISYKIYKKKQF